MGVSMRRLQGWEPSERTVYEYGSDGRLSSSTTTLESEFGPTDLEWLSALLEVERETGPHGFLMSEATDPDADPDLPGAHYKFVAGTPQESPHGGIVWSPTYDLAERARLHYISDLRGEDRDKHAGLIVPVNRIRVTPKKDRVRKRRTAPPSPTA
jgi:hypothetical protein